MWKPLWQWESPEKFCCETSFCTMTHALWGARPLSHVVTCNVWRCDVCSAATCVNPAWRQRCLIRRRLSERRSDVWCDASRVLCERGVMSVSPGVSLSDVVMSDVLTFDVATCVATRPAWTRRDVTLPAVFDTPGVSLMLWRFFSAAAAATLDHAVRTSDAQRRGVVHVLTSIWRQLKKVKKSMAHNAAASSWTSLRHKRWRAFDVVTSSWIFWRWRWNQRNRGSDGESVTRQNVSTS